MSSPEGSPPRSVLQPWQRRLLAVCLGLGLFMAANTVYLLLNRVADRVAAAGLDGAPTDLPRTLQVMVLSHTGVGILLVSLVTAFVAVHLPRVWRLRTGRSVGSGVAALAAGLVLLVTGLFILTAAASEANRWAWWLHVAAAAALPGAYVAHRSVGVSRMSRPGARRFALATGAAVLLLAAVHLVEARRAGAGPDPAVLAREADGAGAAAGFSPPALPPAGSPFFPSPVTTTSGGAAALSALVPDGTRRRTDAVAAEARARGFNATVPIGAEQCARCHADVVAQWSASAHRFSSFNNPFYEASFNDLRRRARDSNAWIRRHAAATAEATGAAPEPAAVKSRWCGACHDPAVVLTGAMDGPIRRGTVEAQAGLTCMACHAVDRVHGVTGNGNYNLVDVAGDPYLFADAPTGTLRAFLHDAAIRARPATHKARMARPVFSTSEYCATCHKVSLPEAVNGYRWLRGQNVYDPWHDSGISRNAARTFYLPGSSRECQDCHMPPEPAPLGDLAARDGTVRSHRFLGANTALPYLRGDTATLRRTEDYLRDGKLRVDVFALRGEAVGGEAGPPVMAVDEAEPTVQPGRTVTVDVVVRNLGVGHTFPGGTNDSNQGWLEFTVLGPDGAVIWQSGALDERGRLDPLAHRYGAVLLDGQGAPIQRRNGQDIHVPAAVQVIGPGTADVGHFAVPVPAALAGGELTLRARLLWRKFDGAFTAFARETNRAGFAGAPDPLVLPVTEIARDEVRVRVADRGGGAAAWGGGAADRRAGAGGAVTAARAAAGGSSPSRDPANAAAARWVRYNDYGIALLLEGDTRLAGAAFREVARLAPDRIDGALNLARTALAAGDLEAAYGHLEAVEALEPGNGRAAWVWGRVLQEDGRYPEAEMAYRRVLQEFPGDRGAWRNLGRTLFLAGRPDEAVDALDAVLTIDPEDRVAHYFRMLALRVAGRDREAAEAEAAFEYYRIDESAQALTRRYRSENPGVNLMAQPIHTHRPAGGTPP